MVCGLPGHGADFGGELGDGEAAGGDGQREGGGERGPAAGLVQVDAAGADSADLGGQRQLIKRAAGDEPVSTQSSMVQNRAAMRPAGRRSRGTSPAPARFEGLGVVHDRLEPQHALAFGIALQRQQPKWTLNSVRSYAGLSITLPASATARPSGRPFLHPEQGPQRGHVQPGASPVATVPKTRSIRAPEAKIRFRLYSAW